jgi:hypothetical protein
LWGSLFFETIVERTVLLAGIQGTGRGAKPEVDFTFCDMLGTVTLTSNRFLTETEDIGAFPAEDVVFVVIVIEGAVFIFTFTGA